MEYQEILYEVKDAVATITLNRPKALNALTRTLRRELLDALNRTAEDDSIRVLILTGAGKGFCVGQDVKEMADDYAKEGPELGKLVESEYIPLVQALRSMPKPTISLVNGVAVGGGMAFPLASDFRILTEKSTLTPVFVNVGIAPDTGISFLLGRAIGHTRAIQLCMLGKSLNPGDLVDAGLADKVHPTLEEANEAAQQLAAHLAKGPTQSYWSIRQLFDQAAASSLEETLALERDAQDRLAHTE
ncbi:MAG TPA: enoyl-CoA hydratase/isomerase family protein, partial [Bacillales bacterium]|nr:enoyl-CoA hydratase/isomerase family protein [Bacillales bacterium]